LAAAVTENSSAAARIRRLGQGAERLVNKPFGCRQSWFSAIFQRLGWKNSGQPRARGEETTWPRRRRIAARVESGAPRSRRNSSFRSVRALRLRADQYRLSAWVFISTCRRRRKWSRACSGTVKTPWRSRFSPRLDRVN